MIISINRADTWIFIAVFAAAFFLSLRRAGGIQKENQGWLSPRLSQELKGLAILALVFSHFGYCLVADHRFLWPLTILAGVGVNLFLFLSGYGLATSASARPRPALDFYRRRLGKIFSPFWLVLSVLFLLDALVLKIHYSWTYIAQSVLGIFTSANLYRDVNSPLWYFTLILLYYLAFPLVWSRRRPWASAILLYGFGWLLVYASSRFFSGVTWLYRLHILAFPLGVLACWLAGQFNYLKIGAWLRQGERRPIYYFVLTGLLALFVGLAAWSGVGQAYWREELASILTVMAVIFFFSLKRLDFRLFSWFGLVSYEIYLWHWPIMYRYDFLYRSFPAWLATIFYLVFFWLLGYGTTRLVGLIGKRRAE